MFLVRANTSIECTDVPTFHLSLATGVALPCGCYDTIVHAYIILCHSCTGYVN